MLCKGMLVVCCMLPTVIMASFDVVTITNETEIINQYRGDQQHWPAPAIDKGVIFSSLAALPEKVVFPESNLYSKEKYELGKQLFFDRRLSKSEQIACASCHDPDLGWADGRRQAIGHNRQQHDLNSPSIINTAWLEKVFWNGRADSLEAQIIETWQNPVEMAANLPSAVARIKAVKAYTPLFEKAFASPEISAAKISQAMATFMRTITLSNTRFDRFMRGKRNVFSDQEIKGLHLFRTKARCINCHHGSLLTDGRFHHLGSSFHNVDDFEGRYRVTKKSQDVGAFRTPGLRGINETAPYLHNGLIKSLESLIAIYNNGWWQNAALENKGNEIPTAVLSSHIKKLSLSQKEVEDLIAFLDTLEGNTPWVKMPAELK